MTDNEIKINLCNYDEDNPYNILDLFEDDDRPEPRNGCACDNCFYGRDKLAVQILETRRELAAERALADRLAGQLEDCLQSQEDIGWVMQALAAWREARATPAEKKSDFS